MVSCLLIERNVRESTRVQALLETIGLSCDHRTGAEEGIRFCHENSPDVVVMEVTEASAAKEFLRLVRHQGRSQGRPVVIFYSDRADMGAIGASILEGASEFLMQPFDKELLQFKLRQAGVMNALAA